MHQMIFAVNINDIPACMYTFSRNLFTSIYFATASPKYTKFASSVQNGEHLQIIRFAQLLLGGMADNLFESISIYSSKTSAPDLYQMYMQFHLDLYTCHGFWNSL